MDLFIHLRFLISSEEKMKKNLIQESGILSDKFESNSQIENENLVKILWRLED